ncbi:hypothetical protein GCM10009810_22890 [Nostocoides vanveenii]|uniref:Uncharacterized protein n=1 Tax=Nostocoides vanveenii TaxID=330835 RepID=A0ABP4WU64_9MICO
MSAERLTTPRPQASRQGDGRAEVGRAGAGGLTDRKPKPRAIAFRPATAGPFRAPAPILGARGVRARAGREGWGRAGGFRGASGRREAG